MKKNYFLTLIFAFHFALAQVPAGYYNSANGTGYALKSQLHNIIDDHNGKPYSNIGGFFQIADRDLYYENNNTILDPYSENPQGPDPYNYAINNSGDQCGNYDSEGDCYNAEHVIPQSVFGQSEPMRGDAHHLLPTDGRVNGFRSNYPFGVAGTLVTQNGISNPTMNGSKLGSNLNSGYSAGYTGLVFEPIDEFKGDIARIYFYFATRYQDVIPGWTYPMFDGTSSKTIADPFLRILLTWHTNDPVSQKEIDRNNAIYTYQGNRNPFVDHPEYACMIWSSTCTLSNSEFSLADVAVYPVPSRTGQIFVSSPVEINDIQMISISGQVILTLKNPRIDDAIVLEGLPKGFYFLTLTSNGDTLTRKVIIE